MVVLCQKVAISQFCSCSWVSLLLLFMAKELITVSLCRIAYVRQEDLIFSQLTVREMLSFAAELQLPDIIAPERKDSYVNDLLFRLGLLIAKLHDGSCLEF
jgi:ABC-type lipopolysaccharide export system ATPase subunit